MELLNNKAWRNIFKNLEELEEENYYDGVQNWVEPIYLDPIEFNDSKWGLAFGEELFEEGFETELDAEKRLEDMEKMYYDTLL